MRARLVACLVALGVGPAAAQQQVNVYNWSDYIAEDQLKVFSQQTGIKVNYTTYDTNEILDAKLKAGRSGYDVVVPTASPFLVRQLAAKLYQPLDKAKLRNRGNLDPTIMAALAKYDPGRSEEHTSELQSHSDLVCRLLLEKKKPISAAPEVEQRGGCGVVAVLHHPLDSIDHRVGDAVPDDDRFHLVHVHPLCEHADPDDAC